MPNTNGAPTKLTLPAVKSMKTMGFATQQLQATSAQTLLVTSISKSIQLAPSTKPSAVNQALSYLSAIKPTSTFPQIKTHG